jgi:hypothetical protein
MKKVSPTLSPASFVAVYTPHTTAKHAHENSILTELLVKGEATGAYSMQMEALRERFNTMYYKFINKVTSPTFREQLSLSQQENLNSLFDELMEMRTLLEKESILTT